MANDVYLGIPGIKTSFEAYERGRTVLYVVHDRETPSGFTRLLQSLKRRRAPFGRYDRIMLKPDGNPDANWRS